MQVIFFKSTFLLPYPQNTDKQTHHNESSYWQCKKECENIVNDKFIIDIYILPSKQN